MEKQITIPLLIPYDLENYILNELPSKYSDIPTSYSAQPILIPVHDPARRDPHATLPSLVDVPGEAGNLRYWVISNTNMWACQHRVMDEVFEILWPLFHRFIEKSKIRSADMSDPEAILYMAKSFRRRCILPNVTTQSTSSATTSQRAAPGVLDPREAALFRAWVFAVPYYVYREFTDDWDERGGVFDEEAYMYPVPDELFWKDEDVQMS